MTKKPERDSGNGLGGASQGRRQLLRAMLGTAYAVPLVATLSVDELDSSDDDDLHLIGGKKAAKKAAGKKKGGKKTTKK